ncbi:hypothetical protein BD779DRAFT_1433257 [Infundibulicybe gibba]|nr:hypothetical protein BD779DRAFT_1433257 [Infundibulicybe gibba]
MIPPGFIWPLQFCAFSTVVAYVASLITSNVSQVDRVWTFLPTIYTAYYALLPIWPQEQPFPLFPFTPKELSTEFSPRAVLMLGLTVIWMCRLSYNTYRRGLFNLTEEDYRWAVLRQQLPSWLFQLTNITFIATIQNLLLLLLGLPAQLAATYQRGPLATSDYALTALALLLLVLEFTADNQQYSFQTYKYALIAKESGNPTAAQPYNEKDQWVGARLKWTPEDAKRGFITRGLWAYSRHPNFTCEQSFWWVITLFPLLAPSPPFLPAISPLIAHLTAGNITLPMFFTLLVPALQLLSPALSLSLLFFSSTLFTEAITKAKYTERYALYCERVDMFGIGTLGKGLWLAASGRKSEVERDVWGSGKKE